MSSITLTVAGKISSLDAYFYPEIELDEQYNYSCCLLGFYTYNSISNVYEKNNKFYYSTDGSKSFEFVTVPVGSYEIDEIIEILNNEFNMRRVGIVISSDRHTMKCTLVVTKAVIDFTKNDCIRTILGFKKRVILDGIYKSDGLVDIQRVKNLRIDCDLISGSYHNGKSTHTIYEFDPDVDPGYKINEQPKHLIYLPVVRHRISTINISILDHNGELVDFRGEDITCRIHIKRDT